MQTRKVVKVVPKNAFSDAFGTTIGMILPTASISILDKLFDPSDKPRFL